MKLSLGVLLQLLNFLNWSSSRGLTQLMNVCQHKSGYSSVSLANMELELDVVVADSH